MRRARLLKLSNVSTRLRIVLGTGGAVLVVAVLIAAFARVLTLGRPISSAATPTAPAVTRTPTPVPTVPLTTGAITWHSVALPPGFPQRVGTDVFAVAPSDGDTVYACFTPPAPPSTVPPRFTPQTPQLWVTHDRAATWRQVHVQALTQETGTCYVQVDRLDPAVAIFGVAPPQDQQHPTGLPLSSFVTFDGGITWSARPGQAPAVFSHTRNGVTYALRESASGTTVRYDVAVSRDGMATWRAINPPPGGDRAQGLWGGPETGELLTLLNTGDIGWELWSSRDGGAHWRRWSIPAMNGWIAREAANGQPWLVCGTSYNAGDHAHPSSTMCSQDNGATWTPRPGLPPRAEWPQMIAVTDDSSLLGRGMQQPYDQASHVFYRLAPGAGSWELLAETPPNQYRYARGPGVGVLWMGPAFDGIGQYQGNQYYVADYPG